MDQLRIGIIGCGMVSRYHAKAIAANSGALLVGAASRSLASTEKFCSEYPDAYPYADLEQMLEDTRINTIAICSPSGNHFEHSKQALLAGKNIIVEKPFCLKLDDADQLICLARDKHLEICCISQSRFSDSSQAVKKAIEEGQMGKMVSCSLMMRYLREQSYYDQALWRGTFESDGGGVLMNQGIHGIDLLCFLMGHISSVMGYVRTRLRKIEVEDTGAAAVEFENGAIGVIDATVCSIPSFTKRFILCGEKGTVIIEDDSIKLWSLPTPCPLEFGRSINGSSASDPRGISTTYHEREYRNIVDICSSASP